MINTDNISYYNPISLINSLTPNRDGICETITSAITTPLSYLTLGLTSIVNTVNFNRFKDQKPTDEELMRLKPEDWDQIELNANEIWKKRIVLFTLVKKLDGFQYWKDHRIETILKKPEILDRLNLKLSLDEIQEIFDKYHVIVLRKPSKDKLMNYCGNEPIYSAAMRCLYHESERSYHRHEEYDTVDCDLLMNPTIVSEVNSRGLEKYLNSIGHKYDKIEGDIMTVVHSSPKKEIPILSAICKENAIIPRVYAIETTQTKEIKEVEELARIHGFISTQEIKIVEIMNLAKSGNIELMHTIEQVEFSFSRNQ